MNTKSIHILFSFLALFAISVFGYWWFNPSNIAENFTGNLKTLDVILFLMVTYVIWHPIIMEVLTWCISSNIRDIRFQKPVPGLRVAFITTIVPKNEPIELLHKCLPAMVRAKYKHDTWLLDESNNDSVKKICKEYGVYHFSRYGISQLNTSTGKYTKTKGGNHNSWYDVFGRYYDYVAQIDTDFVPQSNFLTKTLGYFRDPKVAFVGTPQVYGNIDSSLIARGASEQQLNFYGAVLRGLSSMGMNLLIGANHVIRVKAFQKANHYTAHITEDLVTGMKLHAQGWKSVYVPTALAIGEGPTSWGAYFNQQLRWAYGCIDILIHHSLSYFKKMTWRQRVYYFFLQQHYFYGLAMSLSVFLLSLYFLFGIRAADVDMFRFFMFYSFVLIITWLMSIWMQRYDIHRKKEGQLLLAGKIMNIAAWPVWFLALISIVTGKKLQYKVTPKGENDSQFRFSPQSFIPHFVFALIATLCLVISFFTKQQSPAMIFWALSGIGLMLMLPFIEIIYDSILKFVELLKKAGNFLVRSNSYYLASPEKGNIFVPAIKIGQGRITVLDCLFLGLVIITSVVGYIRGLGFYSDDWSFLGNFAMSPDQSLVGLLKVATTPNTMMRPMQNLYDVALYLIFNLNPLGYHLVNTSVFILLTIVFYLILRKLEIKRIIAVSASVLFALLPNYATDRFWYAAYQVNLSLLFFLLSTFTGLKAFSYAGKKSVFWKAISLLCLVLSGLSYEVILPLVFLNVAVFWNPIEKMILNVRKKGVIQNHGVFIVINLIALVYLIIFKLKTTIRLGDFNYPGDIYHLLIEITRVNFLELGLKLPLVWKTVIFSYTDITTLILGTTIFIICFIYMFLTFTDPRDHLPGRAFLGGLVLSGFVVFLFGYAIFLTNNKVGFSITGIDNRVAIVSSLGMALIIIGLIGLLSKSFRGLFSKWLFCLLVAIMCTGSFITVNTLARFWTSAYTKSSLVLSDIKRNVPKPPSNSTFILDGVCPYVGPGIVFESQWDLKGALQLIYNDPTLQADVVTPRLKIRELGIESQLYTFKAEYPYENLIIYNFKTKQTYELADKNAVDKYFEENNSDFDNDCPPSAAGNGVSVF